MGRSHPSMCQMTLHSYPVPDLPAPGAQFSMQRPRSHRTSTIVHGTTAWHLVSPAVASRADNDPHSRCAWASSLEVKVIEQAQQRCHLDSGTVPAHASTRASMPAHCTSHTCAAQGALPDAASDHLMRFGSTADAWQCLEVPQRQGSARLHNSLCYPSDTCFGSCPSSPVLALAHHVYPKPSSTTA